MEFKHWLISEEIYQNKTAVVYHRTKRPTSIEGIIRYGFRPGSGCYHGCGLYTTYELSEQFNVSMSGYGEFIMAYKVIDLDQYLVFEEDEAKKIHGADWRLSSQIPKLSKKLENAINSSSKINFEQLDRLQEEKSYTSRISQILHEEFQLDQQGLKGIVYIGHQDGKCLLKYEPINEGTDIVLLRYAYAPVKKGLENIQWNSATSLASLRTHSAYRGQLGEKEFSLNVSGMPDYAKLMIAPDIKKLKIQDFASIIQSLNQDEMNNLLSGAKDQQGVMNLVIKYGYNFDLKNTILILKNAKNLKELESIRKDIFNKIQLIRDFDLRDLLSDAQDKNAIGELVLRHRKLKNGDLQEILIFSSNLQNIEKILQKADFDKINDFEDWQIKLILATSEDKASVINLIAKHRKKLNRENLYWMLRVAPSVIQVAETLPQQEIVKIKNLKQNELTDLLLYGKDKDNLSNLILKTLDDFSLETIFYLMLRIPNANQLMSIKEDNLKAIDEIEDSHLISLLESAKDKLGVIRLIKKYKKDLSDNLLSKIRAIEEQNG